RDRDALVRARPRLAEHGLGIRRRIGDRHVRRARGDPREAVLVDAAEVHGRRESYPIAARRTGRSRPRRAPAVTRPTPAGFSAPPASFENGEPPPLPDRGGGSIALHWALGGRGGPTTRAVAFRA